MPSNSHDTPACHLTQAALARRWGISPRTLERWRWLRRGPPFLKLGGHVAYRQEDILTYEAAQLRATGPANDLFFQRGR